MPKKDNTIDAQSIARAARFDVTIFLGTGRYWTEDRATLAEARQRASEMAAEVKNGRLGMVYAVTPEGRSIFVPPSFQPATPIDGEPEMSSKELSATSIAIMTATLLGEAAYKRANSKEAAKKRFINVANDKGIDGDAILASPDPKAALAAAINPRTPSVEKGAMGAMERMADAKAKIAKAKGKTNTTPKPKVEKTPGKRAAILAAAEGGQVPDAPDFSAETHKRFRPKLAEVIAMVEAGDLKGLKAFKIKPVSSSPKAIAKYRDLAVIALEARAKMGKAA